MMDMGGGMGGPMGGAVGGGTPATDPVELIAQAVQLHAAHMDGSMPPTPESQAALMTLLQEALNALSGPVEPPDSAGNEALVQKMMQMGIAG